MPHGVDYIAVLEDLRKRRAEIKAEYELKLRQIDAVAEGIEDIIGMSEVRALAQAAHAENVNAGQPYREHTIREAARACLEAEGSPLKTRELADRILKGGFPSDAVNFMTTVYGTLARVTDEFAVEDGWWSLAEWKRPRPRVPGLDPP